MGKYNLTPHRISSQTTHLLRNPSNQHHHPPPHHEPLVQTPPTQPLVRPPLQRHQSPGTKKSSKLFKPLHIKYKEDRLRWEFFNDHPWELARPRVVLEDDGRDGERGGKMGRGSGSGSLGGWWGVELDFGLNRPREGGARRRVAGQRKKGEWGGTAKEWDEVWKGVCGRVVNGEAVIQRQHHLLQNSPLPNLTPSAAYDIARKEFYRYRHARETETRVAREEAQATGAFFGLGPLEVGMQLEDRAYEDWRAWAIKETVALKQAQGAAYTGAQSAEVEGRARVEEVGEEGVEMEDLQVREVEGSVPGSRKGVSAQGGEGIHP